MIISRTPFRISFLGGGTDLPQWYKENKGIVLSATINKYCYINARKFPPFFDHTHRLVYSEQERINLIDEIKHPAIREVFKRMKIKEGTEIQYSSDLPSKTGLGSSSSFTVGLLHALYGLYGRIVSKERLYKEAIYIEQKMIKEAVGSQDQVAAAIGGLNVIKFFKDKIDVVPLFLPHSVKKEFEKRIMMFFTGFTRFAFEIEGEKIKNIRNKRLDYTEMADLAEDGITELWKSNYKEFGKILNRAWEIKRNLSNKVSNDSIDNIYETAMKAGATGGKIMGAGGGGFIFFLVEPEKQEKVKEALKKLLYVPISFENEGSRIIYYNGDL